MGDVLGGQACSVAHVLVSASGGRCADHLFVGLPEEAWEIKTEQNDVSKTEVFACPVCYEPLIRKGPPGMNLGWRQNFNRSGFPGRDEEFQMAQDYFQSVAGGILVDVSCGSGLFSRKFASSGAYSAVIALDFSENMLRQCYDYIKQEETPMNTNLALIAEISRVLKPGGVFVATTFLSTPTNSSLFSIDALKPLRQIVGPVNSSYNFFTEGELEDLCRSCGLVNYSSKVQRSFIMFSGQKP
ncbi:hypothetical protein TRIUR3_02804 [Triticum urartu]|uniref:Uncharacterized protein n=1 Tax=Triticum urartu TaxID=4572 RepID=M7Z5S0_TRIUA|nr:hypothetical protein TRIUR3_02804 [Triticum urartu]